MIDARDSRKKLLDDHDASIDALHRHLRDHTDAAHHDRLHHAIESVKKSVKGLRDDDAFGSPGNLAG
jgi:hypothetical protein